MKTTRNMAIAFLLNLTFAILEAVGGTLLGEPVDLEAAITSVTTDSRGIRPGALFIPLSGEQSIAEVNVPKRWIGKTLRELDVRASYGVNVIGLRAEGSDLLNTAFHPDYRFSQGETLMVIGLSENIARMLK